MNTLFVTTVGSHMWGMQTPESEIDRMSVYQVSTRSILEGRPVRNTEPDWASEEEGVPVDWKGQEIGHLVNKLIDGNVNAIWTVCSPIVVLDHPYLQELRKITENNLSKKTYNSIRGMAISQFKDHTRRAKVMPEGKALLTAWRTCSFGQTLLLGNKVEFKNPGAGNISPDDVEWILESLHYAYERSNLPEQPDENKFREFMYRVRTNDLLNIGV